MNSSILSAGMYASWIQVTLFGPTVIGFTAHCKSCLSKMPSGGTCKNTELGRGIAGASLCSTTEAKIGCSDMTQRRRLPSALDDKLSIVFKLGHRYPTQNSAIAPQLRRMSRRWRNPRAWMRNYAGAVQLTVGCLRSLTAHCTSAVVQPVQPVRA